MVKRKEYQVSLVSPGVLDENIHYGQFSRDWWETRSSRCTNTNNKTATPVLYPIRINMRTLVLLRNTQFIITVVKGHPGSLQQPGYICQAGDLTSAIFNNPSSAVTTLYQRLFDNNTKFSGPLIMGHDKIEISEQLLEGVNFVHFVVVSESFGYLYMELVFLLKNICIMQVQDLSLLLCIQLAKKELYLYKR